MTSFARGDADHVDQVLHRRGAVAQAHARRRDAEARVVGGDAQVAGVGDVEARAQAVAAHHRHRRLLERLRAAPARPLRAPRSAAPPRGPSAALSNCEMSAPETKALLARAGEDDHADRGVGGELVEHARDRLPHVDRHGVQARRVAEDHPADRAVLARLDASTRSYHLAFAHRTDVARRITELAQDLVGVLADLGRRASPARAGVRESFTAWLTTLKRPSFGCSTCGRGLRGAAPADRRTPRPCGRSGRRARPPAFSISTHSRDGRSSEASLSSRFSSARFFARASRRC